MLRPTDWECSLYDEVADHENKDAFKKLKKEYSDFFKFLKNVTGYEKVGFGKAASLNNLNREVRFSFDSPTLFTGFSSIFRSSDITNCGS